MSLTLPLSRRATATVRSDAARGKPIQQNRGLRGSYDLAAEWCMQWWWLIPVVVLVIVVLAWRPLRSMGREIHLERARELFVLQRERLEAKFMDAAAATG